MITFFSLLKLWCSPQHTAVAGDTSRMIQCNCVQQQGLFCKVVSELLTHISQCVPEQCIEISVNIAL